jgi:hypothetical protein
MVRKCESVGAMHQTDPAQQPLQQYPHPQKNTLQGQQLHRAIEAGTYNVPELTALYYSMLYRKHGTWQAVARVTGLDRRTVKKYLDSSEESSE